MSMKSFAALVLIACSTSLVQAQQQGGGQQGGGGTSSFGLGGTFGQTGQTGGTTTSAPLASSIGATTGTGTTGATGTTAAASGLSNFGVGSFGAFDSGFGATTFGGNATAGLLGAAASRGGLGSSFGGGRGGFGNTQNNQNNQNQTKLRATVKIGFDYPGPSPAAKTQAIVARLNRMPLPDKFSGVAVTIRGRTAVLSGNVPSESDGKLVERLLSLEMGIDGVENNLVIQPVAPAGEIVPLPSATFP